MVLSKEEMELLDPRTTAWRKLAIRIGMLGRFTGVTAMVFVATSLIVIAAIIVFLAIRESLYGILE